MTNTFDRTLSVYADGEPVTSSVRTCLLGHEGLGLYPSLFMDRWGRFLPVLFRPCSSARSFRSLFSFSQFVWCIVSR